MCIRDRACEIEAYIANNYIRDLIAGHLLYDVRDQGGRGRALASDIPKLPILRKYDRLEPRRDFTDVSQFEHKQTPCYATVWRTSREIYVKHRCPFMG